MKFGQSKVNRAIRRRFAVEAELTARPGDARRLLVDYHEHPNIQVQLNAATATLALFPEEARRCQSRGAVEAEQRTGPPVTYLTHIAN
ncbi:hypothetical protein GGR03_003852 [Aurantimonas endophytica]|uniref:DUF2019 domain-containing protein n=1 Tax=Aurantimonas endophytica TaxID=1522175 RepID=A0A7W6MR77_9HYPH|nr:hypothetical protein [Aurantimonas endophytica]MCO6405569.1 DUF2019 domain-containing protein [Aurantimonas endophytica]